MPSSSPRSVEDQKPEAADPRLPFARGEDRLRLLYTLPLVDTPAATLLIGEDNEETRALRDGWSGAVTLMPVTALTQERCSTTTSGNDVVLLPGALRAGGPPPGQVVRAALAALRPGGVLVGHAVNMLSVHALHGVLRGELPRPWSGWAAPADVERSLREHGCVDAECFLVEPRAAAPMVLIPADRAAARRHFLIAVRRNRPMYDSPGYLLRLLLARCGLGGMLQPDIFFWARRPC